MRSIRALVLLVGSASFAGCGDAPTTGDSGHSDIDTGTPPMDDGGAGCSCGAGQVCVDGTCTASRCGDGIVDSASGEQCDDSNAVAFDGCTSCQFDCVGNDACDDHEPCNGAETCSASHACGVGTPLSDGTTCTSADVTGGVCRSHLCVLPGCGNSIVETGEDCDDGQNHDDADGCKDNCHFTCTAAADCDDHDACTGTESCGTDHRCAPGTALDCADTDACTMDICNPASGCGHPLIDGDGDGFPPISIVGCGTDCDDARSDVHPGATELCDAIDQDCNGDPLPTTTPTWYLDCDGDGFASGGARMIRQCAMPPADGCGGSWTLMAPVAGAQDCDDTRSAVHPGVGEVCDGLDNDCNGAIDNGVLLTFYRDADGDAHGIAASSVQACTAPAGYVASSDDCNDACATCYPGRSETCDGLDNDCNGTADNGVLNTYYRDSDGDAHGNAASSTTACSAPAGYVSSSDDCNDTCATCYPGRSETCDGLDNDCNGTADNGVLNTYYRDSDGDSHGNAASSTTACSAPAGYVTSSDDCNDACATCYPGRAETCDGLDNDCNGTPDNGVLTTYYRDSDVDGYGNGSAPMQACSAPAGYVTNSTDCNDACNTCYPGHAETCDGLDNDCNGTVDNGVLNTYYRDADGDGYGTSVTTTACTQPGGYATTSGDCNDSNASVHPGAAESCDGVDSNCNGFGDEPYSTYYRDADGDTYGNASLPMSACSMPAGYVTNASDCCDSDLQTRPSQTSWFSAGGCAGFDFNCSTVLEHELTGNRLGTSCATHTTPSSCSADTGAGWFYLPPPVGSGGDPGCGNSGSWVNGCTWNATTARCDNLSSTRTQRCH